MFKPIYEPKGRAREYCDLAINIYTGCNHGCVYCYGPNVLHKQRSDFEQVKPRDDIVKHVEDQLAREDFKGREIMLCFVCDPYPAEIDTTPTRRIIKAIKEAGAHVRILTKGGFRAERDFGLLGDGDSFGVTISSFRGQEEPRAAHPMERLNTLRIAHCYGIKTWVSCEPVFNTQDIYDLITDYDYIDLYRIGKLNYMPSSINWREFGTECERLCLLHGRNYYIKNDLRAEMDGKKGR